MRFEQVSSKFEKYIDLEAILNDGMMMFEVEFQDISEVLSKYPLKLRTKSEIWAIFGQSEPEFQSDHENVAQISTNLSPKSAQLSYIPNYFFYNPNMHHIIWWDIFC